MTIASIDIGSNTVLLLIAEVNPGEDKISPVRDEQRLPRISEGLTEGGLISGRSLSRLMSVLKEYFSLIKEYKCEKVLISGTSAFRKAANGEKIKSIIKNEFNTEMNILTGSEEAEFAFLGTGDYGSSGSRRLVIDIGGGSTEIIFGTDKLITFRKSFDLGVVPLSEKYISKNEPAGSAVISIESDIKIILNEFNMLPYFNYAPDISIALDGTPVSLACISKGMKEYDEGKTEGSILTKKLIEELVNFISGISPAELLNQFPEIVKGREDLILTGAVILLNICKILNLSEVIVSTKGIRYGAILKFLSNNA